MILPFVDQAPLYNQWNFNTNVLGNSGNAQTDIPGFYCPTRRSTIRREDTVVQISGFTKGGTDYGGCVGSGNMAGDGDVPHTVLGHRGLGATAAWLGHHGSGNNAQLGIIFPNGDVQIRDAKDGTSNTIITGEMQRLTGTAASTRRSEDGWASGGLATLFTTDGPADGANIGVNGGMNGGRYESPGSDHVGGAHFGLADGAVRFISENIDEETFERLGAASDDLVVGEF